MADEATNEVVTYDVTAIQSPSDLKNVLYSQYMKQINNYFEDEKTALRFLSSVMADVQRTPALIECEPHTLVNSYITMAQLQLMPSGVSGEAYVLPYKNKGKMEAQFQLGYQGLITLFYRAGVQDIKAEIVHENDEFDYVNGEVTHRPKIFGGDRGEAIGAYVIVTLQTGGKVAKVMSKEEIMEIGKKYSKGYSSDYSPWKEKNDPQLWMWRKTVLKQAAKLIPKNETINRAVAEDNKDSIISDRLDAAKDKSESLKMGALLNDGNKNNSKKDSKKEEVGEDQTEPEAAADGETVYEEEPPD